MCNRVKTRKSLLLFCLRLSRRGVFWPGVERESLCCITGGWPVVSKHGNQLSHEERKGWRWGGGTVVRTEEGGVC